LLGGQYVGITAGGAEEYLKSGDRIELVQDALVLENLINQLVASFSQRNSESGNSSKPAAEESK
jgi:phospholipid/cholesterol/gamma-HCH transport system substrate-binding protein